MFRWLAEKIAYRAAKFAGIPLRDPALVKMLGGQPTESGVDIDERLALNISAVWQAVNIISGPLASLPLYVYEKTAPGTKRVAEGHPAHQLLHVSPNDEMTPIVFHETLQAHALTWGNGYARIEWEGDVPREIVPLMPDQIEPDRGPDGELYYRFVAKYEDEKNEDIPADEMIHIPGLGFTGRQGYSVIGMARESLGLTAASERYGASLFGRGAVPGGVLETENSLEERARKNLRESWELMHRGPQNEHRVAILDEGIKFRSIGLPPEDSQFLQTRGFQVVEVARWFNVPPHMLRDLSQATFSNIEHQGLDFLIYTLGPWLMRWRQEYTRKLFRGPDRRRYGVAHDVKSLLQTDTQGRYTAYATGRNNGFLTLNDILRSENMNTISDGTGDQRIMPANMTVIRPGATPGVENATNDGIEKTAMNGAQVSSLLTILQAVSANTLATESAHQMVRIAFPDVPETNIIAMLAPYAKGRLP
jgi:HK97 family phage portal protein